MNTHPINDTRTFAPGGHAPPNRPPDTGAAAPHSTFSILHSPLGGAPAAAAPAFTLIEILVAMAIATMVFVAVTTLLFSMGELWGRNSDARLFDLHARNVTRFLQRELSNATLPPIGGPSGPMNAANPGSANANAATSTRSNTASTRGSSGNTSTRSPSGAAGSSASGANAAADTPDPISIQDIRDSTGNSNPLITYQLPGGSRLTTWPDRALPNVVCSLQYRAGAGLLLLWHSYLEDNFDTDAPRETLITPLVTALTYDYYDANSKTWKNETDLRLDNNNQGILPQRLHLIFTYAGRTIDSVIVIPATPIAQGLPML